MKNKFSKWWFIFVAVIPVALMGVLHIGIALGQYFGININVPNVDASTWFMFCGSYLAGAMTLGGVILTLKHERNVNQYQISIDAINKERELIICAICELDIHCFSSIYNHFLELETTNTGYRGTDIAEIQRRIFEKQRILMQQMIVLRGSTELHTNISLQCSGGKTPDGLSKVHEQFQEIYNRVASDIYDTLSFLASHVQYSELNALKDFRIRMYQTENEQCKEKNKPLPYSEQDIEKERSSKEEIAKKLLKDRDNLKISSDRMAAYTQKEIPQLVDLTKEYYNIRVNNDERRCFSDKTR